MATRLPAPVRREQLLDVALEQFGANGFHLTSMNGIATRAGVTKPVLYQHFQSKGDLYLAVLANVGERLRADIEAAAGSASSPQEMVEAGFRSYFGFFDKSPAAFPVLFGETSRADRRFSQEVASVESAMAQWVSAILTIDYLDERARTLFGHAIVGMAEGAVRHWFSTGREATVDELSTQMTELAWIGLRGRR